MRKLWLIFIAIFVFSFAILGWVGTEIFRQAPPIPREVVTTEGQVLIAGEEISNGQNVWQAMGGMESGSICGHGSYVAPDWSADYLHREALFILNDWSRKDFSNDYDNLTSEQKAVLRQRLQDTVRKNNYDEASGRLTIEPVRAQAFEDNLKHYTDVFTDGKTVYAVQRNAQIGFCRLLVGAEFRVHADRADADSALDANDRRHNIRPWRNRVRVLRAQFDVATSR